MELPLVDQLKSYLDKSKKVLIALPHYMHADPVAAGLAWKLYLEQLGKEVVVASSGQLDTHTSFLPGTASITSELQVNQNFVVSVSTKNKKLGELSYHTEGDAVKIFLKAKEGSFTAEDITLHSGAPAFDLIILLGVANFEALGKLFTDNAEAFYDTPKVNIDVNSGNEYLGAINVVDVRAVSLTEVVNDVFTSLGLNILTPDIATALLTGIMANTQSYQSVKTTPKTLSVSAELLAAGARQQDVVQFLFKTKPLSLLKLWGRALARLKVVPTQRYVYSVLNKADLEKTETTETDLPMVLTEFLENIAGFKTVGLVVERAVSEVVILLAFDPQLDIDNFLQALGAGPVHPQALPGGKSYITTTLVGADVQQAEQRLIESLRNSLPQEI